MSSSHRDYKPKSKVNLRRTPPAEVLLWDTLVVLLVILAAYAAVQLIWYVTECSLAVDSSQHDSQVCIPFDERSEK